MYSSETEESKVGSPIILVIKTCGHRACRRHCIQVRRDAGVGGGGGGSGGGGDGCGVKDDGDTVGGFGRGGGIIGRVVGGSGGVIGSGSCGDECGGFLPTTFMFHPK